MNLWDQMKDALSGTDEEPDIEVMGLPEGYEAKTTEAGIEITKVEVDDDSGSDDDVKYEPRVPPIGPRDAPIAFVTARASEVDVIRGQPLCGPAGETLRTAYLKSLDVGRADVFILSLVPDFLEDESGQPRGPTDKEFDEWRPWFTKALAEANPRLVVALGTEARDALGHLADEWVPHPLKIRKHGDWGEATRKITRIRKQLDEQGDTIRKAIHCRFLKARTDRQLVTGVVLEPGVPDAHDDVFSVEEIEKAAHQFMRDSQMIGLQHSTPTDFPIVESFVAPQDMEIGGSQVVNGSWVMTAFVGDADVWSAVKNKKFTGFSINGVGKRIPISP
jgi:uracil-DNA glycosylase family 4